MLRGPCSACSSSSSIYELLQHGCQHPDLFSRALATAVAVEAVTRELSERPGTRHARTVHTHASECHRLRHATQLSVTQPARSAVGMPCLHSALLQQHGHRIHCPRRSIATSAQSSAPASGAEADNNRKTGGGPPAGEVPGRCPTGLLASEVLMAAEQERQLPPAGPKPGNEPPMLRARPPPPPTSPPSAASSQSSYRGAERASSAHAPSTAAAGDGRLDISGDRGTRARRGAPLVKAFATKVAERLAAEARRLAAEAGLNPASVSVKPNVQQARLVASYVLGSEVTVDDAEFAAFLASRGEGAGDLILEDLEQVMRASEQGPLRLTWSLLLSEVRCMSCTIRAHIAILATTVLRSKAAICCFSCIEPLALSHRSTCSLHVPHRHQRATPWPKAHGAQAQTATTGIISTCVRCVQDGTRALMTAYLQAQLRHARSTTAVTDVAVAELYAFMADERGRVTLQELSLLGELCETPGMVGQLTWEALVSEARFAAWPALRYSSQLDCQHAFV
jgi:hypothetical protein